MNDSQQPTTKPETEHETNGMKTVRSLQEYVLSRLSNREQLEELTGVLGFQTLRNYRKSSEANREAEDRAVRRHLDRATESSSKDLDLAGDDMANENIVLGGIHNPPAVVYPPSTNGILPTLAAAALAAGIPLAGIAGYLYSQSDSNDRPSFTDRDVKIGLGKLDEDSHKDKDEE